jgi:hypothetical protein
MYYVFFTMTSQSQFYTTTIRQHPVYDFLNDNVVNFLQSIKDNKTQKPIITYFYGGGANGKSCFLDILKSIFKISPVGPKFYSDYYKKVYDGILTDKKPDLIVVHDPSNVTINLYSNADVLKRIGSFGIPVIVLTNILPVETELKRAKDANLVKVIEFNNEYHPIGSIVPYSKNENVNVKSQLPLDEVVNIEAIRIVKELIATKPIDSPQ